MLAAKRIRDNFNRKNEKGAGWKWKKKFISLSAAFDHYESRQMEILMFVSCTCEWQTH